MDLTSVRALASPRGQALLRSLPPYDEGEAMALATRLRAQGHDPGLVSAALTQQRLRARARAKFGEFADSMLFTPDGLEQATRTEVAATHAHRFARASVATVHDLGCGIGADAVTLSAAGVTVRAVDADPVTAAIADVNLRPWPDSRARLGRAEDVVLPLDAGRQRVGAWLDPARRVPGVADAQGRTRRVFRLSDLAPTWSFVQDVAARVPATGAKLSPSFPHDEVPPGTEAQWTSYAGEVLECAIWWGPLAQTPGRTARVLQPGATPVAVDSTMADTDPPAARSLEELSGWLFECDKAVLRAGLGGALTAATGGVETDPGIGYVVAWRDLDVPFARRYLIREAMPLAVKPLRAWLTRHGVTGLTIKQRGVRVEQERLRRELHVGRGAGDGAQATLVLTRVAGKQVVLVVTPE